MTNIILSMVRCRAAMNPRGDAGIPTSELYTALGFLFGATTGEVTDAIREACQSGQIDLSKDGCFICPSDTLSPRSSEDLSVACDLSGRLYDRLRILRKAIGIQEGVAAFIE
jgi:hypothetical protein